MSYHMYVPKYYKEWKKRRLAELARQRKKKKEHDKATEWRTKIYIA